MWLSWNAAWSSRLREAGDYWVAGGGGPVSGSGALYLTGGSGPKTEELFGQARSNCLTRPNPSRGGVEEKWRRDEDTRGKNRRKVPLFGGWREEQDFLRIWVGEQVTDGVSGLGSGRNNSQRLGSAMASNKQATSRQQSKAPARTKKWSVSGQPVVSGLIKEVQGITALYLSA